MMLFYMCGDRFIVQEKSVRDLDWRLSDLWACLGRPHNIFESG